MNCKSYAIAYSSIPYGTVSYCTVLYCILYCTMLYCFMLYYTVFHPSVPYYTRMECKELGYDNICYLYTDTQTPTVRWSDAMWYYSDIMYYGTCWLRCVQYHTVTYTAVQHIVSRYSALHSPHYSTLHYAASYPRRNTSNLELQTADPEAQRTEDLGQGLHTV